MKKYPFIKQSGEKDCGVACLAMIIEYHKGYVPMIELIQMTKTTKEGTTAYDLLKSAAKLGMETKGIKRSMGDWKQESFILPCIVPILVESMFEHYVVLYEIDFPKQRVLIGDPAIGMKRYTFEQFEKQYQAILLYLYPTAPLPIYEKESVVKGFQKVLKPHQKLLVQILLVSLGIIICSLISSYVLMYLSDLVSVKSELLFFPFVLFCFFLLLLKLALEFFKTKGILNFYQKVDKHLTETVLDSILSLPYPYYRLRTTGDFLSRIEDIDKIRESFVSFLTTIVINLLFILGSSVIILKLHILLFFLLILILFILVSFYFVFSPKIEREIRLLQEEKGRTKALTMETILGFETIKGLHLKRIFLNRFQDRYQIYLKHRSQTEQRYYQTQLLLNGLSQMGTFLFFFCAIWFVRKGELSFGSLFVLQVLGSNVLASIQEISSEGFALKEAKQAYIRISNVVPIFESKEKVTISKIENIKFHQFNFPEESPILKKIDCNFQLGEKIMLIGPSGSGKSTLLKVLKGYESIKTKGFQMMGFEVCSIALESIQKQVSYLSQNELLFTDTVSHNLSLNREISLEQLKQVEWICCLEPIIQKMRHGYQSLLEENGFNISGGEKDRIILARTLLNQDSILLIDEGLSQVDTNMERIILKRMFESYPNALIVVVSHRTDNMDLFSRVIEMENGTIKMDVKKTNL